MIWKTGTGQYQPELNANDRQKLRIRATILKVSWPKPLPDDKLHVFVSLPRPEVGSPTTIVQEGSDKPVESGFMKEYDDIFIK